MFPNDYGDFDNEYLISDYPRIRDYAGGGVLVFLFLVVIVCTAYTI